MKSSDRLVADIVQAAGGEITGRVRMQKIFYLLDQLGLESGFSYRYHHYGPYSRDLDEAIDKAKAFQNVREDIAYRVADGMPYSIFKVKEECGEGSDQVSSGSNAEWRALLPNLKDHPPTVLELAATIHWLVNKENIPDWRSELIKRKGSKTGNGRMEKAMALLSEVGLAPA